MRIKNYNGGGYGLNGLSPAGGPISAPLFLNYTPTQPKHAVTKDYVLTTLGQVNASNVVGTLPPDRLPAFTGTHITSPGAGIFDLKPSGVTAGTYNKVTVNDKGLVTHGEMVDFGVLTDVSWSAITGDKPTTLEGYGITNALKLTGGMLSGTLYLTDTPTDDNHLVNKAYIDTLITAKQSQGDPKIGDVVQMGTSTTLATYLRTNGAKLSRTTYAALFAAIGTRFNSSGSGVTGQEFQIPDTTLSDVTGLYTYIKAT